jgi:hypothetical protein
MTHIENIPHILAYGITHKDSSNANPNYLAIGDVSLISTRATKQVNISNGNRSQAFGTITLGDFIPFYFGVRMPMLYVIQHGLNGVPVTKPENIVYAVCKLTDIIVSGTVSFFSDGHATDIFTQFYNSSKITELSTIIDWTAVKSSYWGGDSEDNLELRRKKQAEFLIADDVVAKNICGFVCYSENAKQRLIEIGVDKEIKICPQQAYY